MHAFYSGKIWYVIHFNQASYSIYGERTCMRLPDERIDIEDVLFQLMSARPQRSDVEAFLCTRQQPPQSPACLNGSADMQREKNGRGLHGCIDCILYIYFECQWLDMHLQVLTSTCWLGNGRCFVCTYSNGCIVQWNIKMDSKPEKIFFIHGMQHIIKLPYLLEQKPFPFKNQWYTSSPMSCFE